MAPLFKKPFKNVLLLEHMVNKGGGKRSSTPKGFSRKKGDPKK